jgi:hypothetical protein
METTVRFRRLDEAAARKSTLVSTPTAHQNGIDAGNPQAEKEHVAPEWPTATPSTKHVHCGVSELLQLT